MGRNYIAERTIADPRERAAAKAAKKRHERQRHAAEAAALARYKERAKWCRAPGCDKPATGGEDGWWPCCSEACHNRWEDSLK